MFCVEVEMSGKMKPINFEDIEVGMWIEQSSWNEPHLVTKIEDKQVWLTIPGLGDSYSYPSFLLSDHVDNEKFNRGYSALDIQIGGDHYKTMPIQPMEYSMKNGLDACQHTIIKYVTRFRDKGGIEDLEKAKHCIDLLIGFEREKE